MIHQKQGTHVAQNLVSKYTLLHSKGSGLLGEWLIPGPEQENIKWAQNILRQELVNKCTENHGDQAQRNRKQFADPPTDQIWGNLNTKIKYINLLEPTE